MGFRLLLYLVVLLLGGLIGYSGRINKNIMDKLSTIQTICLLFLLLVMGVTIGMNDKVISSFFTIGLKAIIMSIFTVSFSVLGLFLLRKFVLKRREKIDS